MTPLSAVASPACPSRVVPIETGESPARPLAAVLGQLAVVVSELPAAAYAAPPAPITESSVGGHVRHILDHVVALLGSLQSGLLDYDLRRRGAAVETSVAAALEEIGGLWRRLVALPSSVAGRAVEVSMTLSPSDPPARYRSSFGRELAYVLSHTTHHNAIIGLLVRSRGGEIPDRFGYGAPTLVHLDRTRCAR